jgi:predicted aspartyl protease
VNDVTVDTGSERTWMPAALPDTLGIPREKSSRFRLVSGTILRREIGYVIVHAGGRPTADDVVFAEASDLLLLGARSIEGLSFKVDVANRQFVATGPVIAVAAPPEGSPGLS